MEFDHHGGSLYPDADETVPPDGAGAAVAGGEVAGGEVTGAAVCGGDVSTATEPPDEALELDDDDDPEELE